MAPFFVHFIISPNINRFLKFFHCQNQGTICDKTITTDPTTNQVCHYTTL